jgi:hypothetical protein
LNRVGEPNFAEDLCQAVEASEWGDGFGCAAKMNLARAETGVDFFRKQGFIRVVQVRNQQLR